MNVPSPHRMQVFRRVIALFLVVAMVVVSFPVNAFAATYGTPYVSGRKLNYNASRVAAVGTQAADSVACYCYSYAYAQTIVTGNTHQWYDYDKYGGANGESGAYGKAVANYKTYSLNTDAAILSRLYTSINQGHPCVVRVINSKGGSHWVCVVGYQNVRNPNSLTRSNFLIIDPASRWGTTSVASLSRYSLYHPSKTSNRNLRVSTKTVSTTETRTSDATSVSSATAVASTSSLPPSTTQTSTVAGPYTIVPLCATGSAIDLKNQNTANKTNVHIWTQHGGVSQQFYLIKNADGTFSIQSAMTYGTSNLAYLHTVDQYSRNGTNVHCYANSTNPNSHWVVQANSDGSYSFRNANSDLYLDVTGKKSANGTNIETYAWNGGTAQKFNLVPVVETAEVEVPDSLYVSPDLTGTSEAVPQTEDSPVLSNPEEYGWADEISITVPMGEGVWIDLLGLKSQVPGYGAGYVDWSYQDITYLNGEEYAQEHNCWTALHPSGVAAIDGYTSLRWYGPFVKCWYVYGCTPGTQTITGTSEDGSSVVRIYVTVPDVDDTPLEDEQDIEITISDDALEVEQYSTAQLTAEAVSYSGADTTISWGSEDEDIATVDENGVVRGVAPGTVVVYASNSCGTEVAECVVTVTPSTALPMYRLYNRWSYEHFYTGDVEERDFLVSQGWTDEGVGWVAPAEGDPVYRLYNKWAPGGDHHYTMDLEEYEYLCSVGWTGEGVGWYSDPNQAVPVYREYNPYETAHNHNYTPDKAEHDHLVSLGWHDEGIGWYGVEP